MVIQKNMPVSEIVKVWPETLAVFKKYTISIISNDSLEKVVDESNLTTILNELNQTVGSSEITCVEGG